MNGDNSFKGRQMERTPAKQEFWKNDELSIWSLVIGHYNFFSQSRTENVPTITFEAKGLK